MLNVFPEFFTYFLVAPFILRVVLGIIFLDLGWLIFKQKESRRWEGVMETIRLKPASFFVKVFAFIEIAGGILLIIGLFTQVAAIALSILCLAEIWIERRAPEMLKRNIVFYVLLLTISISLIFLGAGAFAFDLKML